MGVPCEWGLPLPEWYIIFGAQLMLMFCTDLNNLTYRPSTVSSVRLIYYTFLCRILMSSVTFNTLLPTFCPL